MFNFTMMRTRSSCVAGQADCPVNVQPSKVLSGASKRMRHFTESKSANVSIIFGLLMVPFISFAGLSIDFASATREKSKIQTALDAAALAAGRAFQVSGSETDAKAAASLYFKKQTGYDLTVNTVDPGTFILTVASSEDIPTSFMGVLGSKFDDLTVTASAQAQLVREIQGDKVEVGLMLDVTGSMSWGIPGTSGSRMSHLKAAASDLVNILVQDGDDNVRIGLAPFSRAVNVGSYYQDVVGSQPSYHNCVVERAGANIYTDKKPSNSNGWFRRYNAHSRYCPDAELVPLTSDKSLLLDEIDDLPTSGTTAGHLGTAWAWYLVSKEWSGMFPVNRAPSATSNGVKKIVVLMSDGDYNKDYTSGVNSDQQAGSICDNIKNVNNETVVYSIGFALTENSTPYNRLKNCATSDDHFFPAADGNELRAAFRAIAFNIAELRLVD